jgi:N-dimethylarginine dimethylaminohydrolase
MRADTITPITARRLLMCAPTYFNIEYSINPWMNTTRRAAPQRAADQWTQLHDTFTRLGVDVAVMTPQAGLPDMVYIDAGVIHAGRFIPSNFYYPERQGERAHFVAWFAAQGFQIVNLPSEFYFEGHGDTLWAGRKLFFGYGFRSSIEAQYAVTQVLGDAAQVIPVELTDARFYHLDTCFCPLNDQQALCYPSALSPKAVRLLEQHIELLPISEADALTFACNAVILDKQIVMPEGAADAMALLARHGYQTHAVPMDEFIKGGGACKCLTMAVG